MTGSFLIPLHLVCGLAAGLGCGAFVAYAPYDPRFGADAVFQILGACIPLMVAIVCALNLDTEREAGDMANLLGTPNRQVSLVGKILALWLLGLLALALAAVSFAAILGIAGRGGLPWSSYLLATVGTWASSLCLYMLAVLLAMLLGRNATIGIGVAGTGIAIASLGGMLNGLFSHSLTGLAAPGPSSWIPFTWPTRFGSLGIEQAIIHGLPSASRDQVLLQAALLGNLLPCLVFTLALAVALLLWIGHFEDRRRARE
ncbi:lantibiotic ABC transporter permease [Bifidobacterium aemilianum]|uniref:Lantibiotic ABC transporter permease n=2 Tax=Bifidobacterium aemilianum TaxID=2493120 RepID=A0A366KBX3_9BIFI|nr:lantibiotic ABC transporter permease [Bifidobacterium aemilianum]